MAYTRFDDLEVTGELRVKGKAVQTAPRATKTSAGTVKMAAKVPEAAGSAPTAAEFKALLDSLRDAGIIAES